MQHTPSPTLATLSIGGGVIAQAMPTTPIGTAGLLTSVLAIGGLALQFYQARGKNRESDLKAEAAAKEAATASARADEAKARAERLEKALEQKDAKIDELRADMLRAVTDQLDEYRQYRHDGPDAVVNKVMLRHEAEIRENRQAINTNTPALKTVAEAVGVPVRVADPVEPIPDTNADLPTLPGVLPCRPARQH